MNPLDRIYDEIHHARIVHRNCAECREYTGTGGENITCATCGKPGSDA